jgi:TldD protein
LKDPVQESLLQAQQQLLAPAGLEEHHLQQALGTLMHGNVDSAELYFQSARQESWSLEDGIVREGSHSIDRGVGVRAVAGEKTGFAYSDEIIAPALMQAASAASAIARRGSEHAVQAWSRTAGHQLYPALDPLTSLDDAAKVAITSGYRSSGQGAGPARPASDGEPGGSAGNHPGLLK